MGINRNQAEPPESFFHHSDQLRSQLFIAHAAMSWTAGKPASKRNLVIDALDDPARTGPDPFKGAGCRFTREVSEAVLTRESEDRTYVETFRLEPPSLRVGHPLIDDGHVNLFSIAGWRHCRRHAGPSNRVPYTYVHLQGPQRLFSEDIGRPGLSAHRRLRKRAS